MPYKQETGIALNIHKIKKKKLRVFGKNKKKVVQILTTAKPFQVASYYFFYYFLNILISFTAAECLDIYINKSMLYKGI